jgi:hypothetical protein
LRHLSDRLDIWDHWGIDRAALDDVLGEAGLEDASRNAPPSVVQAMSWKYQYDIVKSVPEPERFITMRYEDFCVDHEQEVARLAEFLGIELEPLRDISLAGVYQWTRGDGHKTYSFLEPGIKELGYDTLPAAFA